MCVRKRSGRDRKRGFDMHSKNAGYYSPVRQGWPHVRLQILKTKWLMICAIALMTTGCPPPPQQGPNAQHTQNQSAPKTSENARFETGKDPPITAETHYAAGRLAEDEGV